MATTTHELKTWIPFFNDVIKGRKKFEVRKNDRDFKLGDDLLLKEYDEENYTYTGREWYVNIQYVLHGGQFGIEEGFVILGF